ncbi:ArpU family phage packaging/lysis transcriptional regulator [Halalkalibacterium halodurans]|nr:ArpU family phage packaging/lysis transcriptional regulator [Halalkalibacterium halodurans]
MSFDLPELDQKKTKEAVEAALEKYRLFKYLTFEEREASITASPEERFHGPTNQTSDQTAQVAIYNADQQEYRRQYCERIERAVKRLPPLERFLIERRYMAEDAEHKTDLKVYSFEFQPPISYGTYAKHRWKAFYKLALSLNIAVQKKLNE